MRGHIVKVGKWAHACRRPGGRRWILQMGPKWIPGTVWQCTCGEQYQRYAYSWEWLPRDKRTDYDPETKTCTGDLR